MSNHFLPLHGGDIISASEHYGIDCQQWIDLSTGINPEAYPVIPSDIFTAASLQQLPYLQPEFIAASTAYYQSSQFIAVSGTQAAIQQLPSLLAPLPVLVPELGYQEHKHYWQTQGGKIYEYPSIDKAATIRAIDQALAKNKQQHLVVINPNNPTGVLLDKIQLLHWAKQLAPQAYLIVDEAFIDTTPSQSVLSETLPKNIIVLRSFGKFFGLAGIRLGYCFAHQEVLAALQKKLGLWQVNGPAQAIASQALMDTQWQSQVRLTIQSNRELTKNIFLPLLAPLTLESLSEDGTLFLSYGLPRQSALDIAEYFAQAGILLRVILLDKQRALLRLGLVDKNHVASVERVAQRVASAKVLF